MCLCAIAELISQSTVNLHTLVLMINRLNVALNYTCENKFFIRVEFIKHGHLPGSKAPVTNQVALWELLDPASLKLNP